MQSPTAALHGLDPESNKSKSGGTKGGEDLSEAGGEGRTSVVVAASGATFMAGGNEEEAGVEAEGDGGWGWFGGGIWSCAIL